MALQKALRRLDVGAQRCDLGLGWATETAEQGARVDEGERLGEADRRGVTAPRPELRRWTEPRLHGVSHDVAIRNLKVALRKIRIDLESPAAVSPGEDVA